jgi:hypothetical protein
MTNIISPAPVVVLSNGLRVANFSSPHPFNFTDGTICPSCEGDRVKAGSLDREDVESPFPGLPGITAVIPKFKLNVQLREELRALQIDPGVDVVLVPFPVLEAIREDGLYGELTKSATICVADRLTKAIFIDRFCR